jgi:hypothetical protein
MGESTLPNLQQEVLFVDKFRYEPTTGGLPNGKKLLVLYVWINLDTSRTAGGNEDHISFYLKHDSIHRTRSIYIGFFKDRTKSYILVVKFV